MRGRDLKAWRQRHGYTQESLVRELQLKSRQTIIAWERSEKLSRIVVLAIQALERLPDTRTVAGERCAAWTGRQLKAREAQRLISEKFGSQEDYLELVDEIGKMSLTDNLTGLYNRPALLALLEKEFERCGNDKRPWSI